MMDSKNNISLQIEKIKTVFQDSKDLAAQQNDLTILIEYLENTDAQFRSIAYEGAAMALALKDIEHLKDWNAFVTHADKKQLKHLYIGLGWAFAQLNHSPIPLFEKLDPGFRFYVFDGYGYYDGLLRQRTSVKNKKLPFEFNAQQLEAYDQGIGRSLWYTFKGEEKKIKEIVNTFSSIRHSALWKGIGIACAHVGGCDETKLRSLLVCAGEYQKELAILQ